MQDSSQSFDIERELFDLNQSCPFDYTAFVVSGKVGIPLTGLTTPVGWLSLPQVIVLSPNRCVIEVFDGIFLLSRCFLDFSVGVGAFVIGLSQISYFFLIVVACIVGIIII